MSRSRICSPLSSTPLPPPAGAPAAAAAAAGGESGALPPLLLLPPPLSLPLARLRKLRVLLPKLLLLPGARSEHCPCRACGCAQRQACGRHVALPGSSDAWQTHSDARHLQHTPPPAWQLTASSWEATEVLAAAVRWHHPLASPPQCPVAAAACSMAQGLAVSGSTCTPPHKTGQPPCSALACQGRGRPERLASVATLDHPAAAIDSSTTAQLLEIDAGARRRPSLLIRMQPNSSRHKRCVGCSKFCRMYLRGEGCCNWARPCSPPWQARRGKKPVHCGPWSPRQPLPPTCSIDAAFSVEPHAPASSGVLPTRVTLAPARPVRPARCRQLYRARPNTPIRLCVSWHSPRASFITRRDISHISQPTRCHKALQQQCSPPPWP